jgi:hypothetical protein
MEMRQSPPTGIRAEITVVLKEKGRREVRQGKRRGTGTWISYTPVPFDVGDCVGPTADVDVYGDETISTNWDSSSGLSSP